MDENIGLIQEFWKELIDSSAIVQGENLLVQRALRLRELPLPKFRHTVWESQQSLPVFFEALNEIERKEVRHFHSTIEGISTGTPQRFKDMPRESILYDSSTLRVFQEFDKLVIGCLDKGRALSRQLAVSA